MQHSALSLTPSPLSLRATHPRPLACQSNSFIVLSDSQMTIIHIPKCLTHSFFSHTRNKAILNAFFSTFVFCVTIPDDPKLCFKGGEGVRDCVVLKCSPKESKVPEVSGSLHKYKCKMPVQVFFSCAAKVVNVQCRQDAKFKLLLLWLFQHI